MTQNRIVIDENTTNFEDDDVEERIRTVLGPNVDVVIDNDSEADTEDAPTERPPAVSTARAPGTPADLEALLDEPVMSVSSGGMWREDIPQKVEQELAKSQGPVEITARPVGNADHYDWEVTSEQVEYDRDRGEFVKLSEHLGMVDDDE